METMKFELCHHENTKWAESLTFYADEIKFFVKTLREVLDRNTNSEVTLQANHYLTLFTKAEQEIEDLAIGILHQEAEFAEYAQGKAFLFDQKVAMIHERRRSAFETLEKDFTIHKHELYKFLTKVL
ncbi:hypothetical protein [Flectobacillus major]|uniref:hypothetical protein n=1 Tax=Flectobacillus major TaxID=103 RepID=UPI00041EFB14|nr:hypothetical protein [Flectobacillus major]